MRKLWKRWVATFGDGADREIREEIEAHLEMRVEQYVAEGMTEPEARRRARQQFGNRLRTQEDARQFNLFAWLDGLRREVRQAGRSLAQRPGLVLVAVVSLALGIGANAVAFSAMDAIFWKPLPVAEPERLVEIQQLRNGEPVGGNPARTRDYDGRLTLVEGVGGIYSEAVTVASDGGALRVRAVRTFGPVLRLLGLDVARGRRFTAEEERGAPVALLTDRFWREYYGGAADVLGRALVTKVGTYTVVGVLPAAARYPQGADFWAPATKDLQDAGRGASFLTMIARLKPEATVAGLHAELAPVNAALAQQYGDTDRGIGTRAFALKDAGAGEARRPLLVMWAAVAVVLVIACLNLASLLLARGMERQREAAIRAALGAGRATLLRTFLVESLLLATGGTLLGLLAAAWGVDAVAARLPSTHAPVVDGRVVAFAVGLAVVCAVALGLVPAWQTAQAGLAGNLNELARASASVRRLWLRGAMVVAQTSLSLVLLGAAGLLWTSFENQRRAPLGFSPDGLVAVRVQLSWDTPARDLRGFTARALERLSALPGVERVGVTDRLPLEGESQSGEVMLRGRELEPLLAKTKVNQRAVSASYLEALRVPVRAGRLFEDGVARHEAVVNEAFARKFFRGVDPVGQAVAMAGNGARREWMEITGVVGDLRFGGAVAAEPELYHSYRRTYWPLLTFVLRTPVPVGNLAAAIREEFRRLDPHQVVEGVAPVETELGAALELPRRASVLAATLAALALVLALIGLYGVLASDVSQRQREFGVRLALGATRGQILGQSLRRGLMLAGTGVVAGVLVCGWAFRFLQSWLVGVDMFDARLLGGAALLMLTAAALAVSRPAWLGASVDPVTALRHE